MTDLPEMPPLACADCGGELRLQMKPTHWERRPGDEHKAPFVYLCQYRSDGCRGLLSAHPDGRPVGQPASQEVRTARSRLHERALDPLWRTAEKFYTIRETGAADRARAIKRIQGCARRRTYAWLAEQLGMTEEEMHVGEITDLETLRKIWRLCRSTDPGKIRAWAKEKEQQAA